MPRDWWLAALFQVVLGALCPLDLQSHSLHGPAAGAVSDSSSTGLLMAIPYLGQQLPLGQELWTKLSWQPNSLSH